MKTVKYVIAGAFALAAIYFLISTFGEMDKNARGNVNVDTGHEGDNRPTAKNRQRWGKRASFVMLTKATNDIVGFRRLIDSETSVYDEAVSNWTGSVTAEFINEQGGVDRTNLYYQFYISSGEIYPQADFEKMYAQALAAARTAITK